MQDLKNLSYEELAEQLAASLAALKDTGERSKLQLLSQSLQTHQIELEMQNRELREAQDRLEASRNRYVDLYDFAPVGYLTFSTKGCITDINLTGARMLGMERAHIINQPMTRWLAAEYRQAFLNHLDTAYYKEEKAVVELKLKGRAGKAGLDVQLESVLTPEDDGEIRCRTAMVDITARKQLDDLVNKRSQELHDSEVRLRAIMESAAEAIVVTDATGVITDFNKAAVEIFGYAANEVIGKNVTLLMPHSYHKAHEEGMARYLETGETRIMGQRREYPGCRRDGSTFPLDLTITEIDDLNVYCGIIRDLTEQKFLERQVAEIGAQEQVRIGHEIHDGLGQQLTAISLMARGLQNRLIQPDPGVKESLDEILEQLQHARDQLRDLSRGLALVTPQGLHMALQKLAEDVQSIGHVTCHMNDSQEIEIADPTVAVQLYRIVQEAINNALKHAGAKNITIGLEANKDGVLLSIRDDGKGFDPAKTTADDFGLRIMRYRASIIGCPLQISATPGEGTLITCLLPE